MRYLFAIILLFSCMRASTQPLTLDNGSINSDDLDPVKFSTDMSHYDQATALYCAEIADLTYIKKKENIEDYGRRLAALYPTEHIHTQVIIDKSGKTRTQVVLWGCRKFVLVAIRGTEPTMLNNWITNGKFWNYMNNPTSNDALCNLTAGHGGFRTAARRLIQNKDLLHEIAKFILEIDPRADTTKFPVVLCGHSLGAGIAQLLIEPLEFHHLNFAGLYNFAPPLSAASTEQARMVAMYQRKTYDIVNYKDYVPRAGRLGVAHFGQFYRICDTGLMYNEPEVFERFSFRQRFRELKYHSLNNHITFIKYALNSQTLIASRSKNGCVCICKVGRTK